MLMFFWCLETPSFQTGAVALIMNCAVFCLLCTWIPVHCFLIDFGYFKIGAFEVRMFLDKTVPDKLALETLVKIVKHYDILFIQEITYTTMNGMELLLKEVNKGEIEYGITSSTHFEQSFQNGQHAYLYRTQNVMVMNCSLYNNTERQFERPPFIVKFSSTNTAITEFTLIGVHISPTNAYQELAALKHVHSSIRQEFHTEDIIILGNMKADCDFLAPSQLYNLDIRQSGFHWLIMDDMDTSIDDSECAYDRFIVSGRKLMDSIVPYSAGVLRYDMGYSISPQQARNISENYPIELFLKKAETQLSSHNNEESERKHAGTESTQEKQNVQLTDSNGEKAVQMNQIVQTVETNSTQKEHFTEFKETDTSEKLNGITQTMEKISIKPLSSTIKDTGQTQHENQLARSRSGTENEETEIVESFTSTLKPVIDTPDTSDVKSMDGHSNFMEAKLDHSIQDFDTMLFDTDSDGSYPETNGVASIVANGILQNVVSVLKLTVKSVNIIH